MISWISAVKKAHHGHRTEAMVFGLAWWLDGTFQELPSRIHPVVWIGHVTRLATRRLRGRRGWDAKLWGGVASLSIISGTALTAHLLDLRSEEHTSELQSRGHLVCRILLEKNKKNREGKDLV